MWTPIPVVALWALTPFHVAEAPAAKRDLVALAAPDAFIALSCADVPALRVAIAQNAWYRGLVDPKGPFHRMMVASDDGAVEGLAALAAVVAPPSDPAARAALDEDVQKAIAIVGAIEGGAAFWFSLNPEDFDRAPSVGIVVESGGSTSALVETVRAVMDGEADAPATVSELGDAPWWTWTHDDEAISLGALDGMTAMLFGETAQIEAHRAAFVTRLGATERGGLRGNARYAEAMASVRVPGQIDAFVDLAPLMALMDAALDDAPDTARRTVDRLGVARMGWVAGRFGVGSGEQLDSEVIVQIPPQTLLAELLDLMRPVPMELVGRVPSEAIAVNAAHYDIAGLVELSLRVAEEIQPGSRSMVDSMLAMGSANLGMDLRADVVDLLDGRFVSFLRQSGTSAGADAPMGMFGPMTMLQSAGTLLIGSRDAAALAESLVQVVEYGITEGGMEGLAWETETVGGVERHTLAGDEMMIAMLGAKPAIAASDGFLVLSFDGSDPATVAAAPAEGAKSVLDVAKLAGPLRQSAHGSVAAVADTAKSMATFAKMMGALSGEFAIDPVELDAAFENHFSGTLLRSIERVPAGLRFYSGAR